MYDRRYQVDKRKILSGSELKPLVFAVTSVAGLHHMRWSSVLVSCLPFLCGLNKESELRNATGRVPCVAKGMGASWRKQPRVPRYKKDKTKLDTAFSNSEAFCSVNYCTDEWGRAMFAQGYMASQIYTVAVRITRHRSVSSAPAVLKFILKCTKLYSCLKCSLIIAEWKILFLNFICISYNFGEAYNSVLLTNNSDLFILLKVFLANERHLLLPVSSPVQTRLFWWDSLRFMLLRNELVGTDKRNETEN